MGQSLLLSTLQPAKESKGKGAPPCTTPGDSLHVELQTWRVASQQVGAGHWKKQREEMDKRIRGVEGFRERVRRPRGSQSRLGSLRAEHE